MRLLDRYVLKIFVSASGLFVLTFLLLSVVVDFAARVEHFFALKDLNIPLFVLKFYLVRLPVFLHFTLPMVAIFAAAFTLIRLSKNNEILPIVASGVSLRRVALPFLLGALLFGGVNAALEEVVLPDLTDRLTRTDEILGTRQVSWGVVAYSPYGTHIAMVRYDAMHRLMTEVRLTKINSEGRRERVISAREVRWNETARQWVFQDGTIEPYDEKGNPLLVTPPTGRPQPRCDVIPREGMILETDIRPRDLTNRNPLTGDFHHLEDLVARIRYFPNIPSLRVSLQSRFSFPFMGLVLLLIGLPIVSSTSSRSFFRIIGLCILIVCAFYGTHLALLDLGHKGRILPVVAAWGSPALFGLPALFLLTRMRT